MDHDNLDFDHLLPGHSLWIAGTKLSPPVLPANVVARTALLHTLNEALDIASVTLISAPAGYGKSTLVAAFCEKRAPESFAWLSLDSQDNDSFRLLMGLVASLEVAKPESCALTRKVLAELATPGGEVQRLMDILVNDLMQMPPIVLVLDDLHVIDEPEALSLLDTLIERLPKNVHLALLTRHTPALRLPLLRSRGLLAEIRLDQLRFTAAEIRAFFNQHANLALSDEYIENIEARTEGWAALLRLLNFSPRLLEKADKPTQPNLDASIADMHMFEFLAQEVFDQLSSLEQNFLLKTSILPFLNEEICREVVGEPTSGQILESLHQRSLVHLKGRSLSSGGRFQLTQYRYHDLFVEFLKSRLVQIHPPSFVNDLHLRAAQAAPGTETALNHLLAARAWEDAAGLISRLGEQLVHQGYLETLIHWIGQLPEKTTTANPQLAYFSGVAAFQRGRFEKAQQLLEFARDEFKSSGNEIRIGEATLVLGAIASGFHDVARGRELLDEALTYPLSPPLQVMAHINRAWVAVYTNDWVLVESDVDQAIRLVVGSEDPGAFNVLAPHLTAGLLFMPNGVQRLKQYTEQVLSFTGEDIGLSQIGANALKGIIGLMEGDLADAQKTLLMARRGSDQMGGFVWLDIGIDFGLLNHALICQEYAWFDDYWKKRLMTFEQLSGAREYLTSYLYIQGRRLCHLGRFEEAAALYDRMLNSEKDEEIPENKLARALMGSLLMIYKGQYPQAEGILRQVVGIQRQAPHSILFGDARILLAVLYLRWGQQEYALSEFKNVVNDYEKRGMVGLLLSERSLIEPLLKLAVQKDVCTDQAAWLLSVIDENRTKQPLFISTTGETLTQREVEVLDLIVAGKANREIAGTLFISETTVKSHVTNILRKLDVRTRNQASALVRELNLY